MRDKFLLPISAIFVAICFYFLFCGSHFLAPQKNQDKPTRHNFSNNGLVTALLTSDYQLERSVKPFDIAGYFSGRDTIYLQMERDGLLFVPTRTTEGTAEYKIYSEISELYAIGLLSISEARTFAYWVLAFPPEAEDTNYINQYYFSVINEKILE
jgi:hypothetical protein